MESAPGDAAKTSTADGSPNNVHIDSFDPLLQPLGEADQACKECRRRKAKCDRAIPTCQLCSRYGRHCLYEKHSKTPLTRKHLTEVEERLERAERLLRQARLKNLLPKSIEEQALALDRSEVKHSQAKLTHETFPRSSIDGAFNFNAFNASAPPFASDEVFGGPMNFTDFNTGSAHQDFFYVGAEASSFGLNPQDFLPASEDKNHPSNTLDGPPLIADDFEWNEQNVPATETSEFGGSPLGSDSGGDDGESAVIDGMASLTMSEAEGGYLGIASGAALLRLIDPSAADQNAQRNRASSRRFSRPSTATGVFPHVLYEQPDPVRHITDAMIDAYFRVYHTTYPIVHEPSFRAQYSEVIERPNGNCWTFLAYVVAAIGLFTTGTTVSTSDLPLFAHAKSLLNINFLESGNLTLVQALALSANYLQKRNKPNSGFNYLGLAVRMATGIGLHKEFQGWKIPPLKMEIRRRVWWCLSVFECGATYTFSRPLTWPQEGIEVALPLNVHDRDLTAASSQIPPPYEGITLYTTIRVQASFHLASNRIYSRVISKPFPSARELINLDDTLIGPWYASIPSYFAETAEVPSRYCTAHAIMKWRYRNFKIIMYRPFVIRQMLYAKQGYPDNSIDGFQAYDRCLHEAKTTIESIHSYWQTYEHSRLIAWYALYFIFQASLIPCICLRNDPSSPLAPTWRIQILQTLSIISSIDAMNPSARRCHTVISCLCGPFLTNTNINTTSTTSTTATTNTDPTRQTPHQNQQTSQTSPTPHNHEQTLQPTNESPQTQIEGVYSMMWPNIPASEADVVMRDDAWMEFLRAENGIFEEGLGGEGG